MAKSTVLIERQFDGVIDCLTSRLVCTKRKEGSFSLQLREIGGFGHLRHPVARRIRCPRQFVDALFSVTHWSALTFEEYEIAAEICDELRKLDQGFANAVADQVYLRQLASHLGNGGRAVCAA